MSKFNPDSGFALVYSTEKGRTCPECAEALAKCRCRDLKSQKISGSGEVRIRRETKGRGGKTVTTVSGLPLQAHQLEALLKDLKKLCSSGGCSKEGVLEIQGDHCERLMLEISKRGFKTKRAGG